MLGFLPACCICLAGTTRTLISSSLRDELGLSPLEGSAARGLDHTGLTIRQKMQLPPLWLGHRRLAFDAAGEVYVTNVAVDDDNIAGVLGVRFLAGFDVEIVPPTSFTTSQHVGARPGSSPKPGARYMGSRPLPPRSLPLGSAAPPLSSPLTSSPSSYAAAAAAAAAATTASQSGGYIAFHPVGAALRGIINTAGCTALACEPQRALGGLAALKAVLNGTPAIPAILDLVGGLHHGVYLGPVLVARSTSRQVLRSQTCHRCSLWWPFPFHFAPGREFQYSERRGRAHR
jgi:hypothetical protein